MHKNTIWLAWLAVISLITLWYAGSATLALWRHLHFTASTIPKAIHWSVKEIKADDFSPLATYTFTLGEQDYHGQTVVKGEIYRNSWGLEEDLVKYENKEWKVWYDPTAPYHSTLQKQFPTKECATALLLFILWAYFVGLGTYVARQMR